MYNELYLVWKEELENSKLLRLPSDFYPHIADYVRKLQEESRMLDKRTPKASLLKKETQNVRSMITELTQARYRKIVLAVSRSEDFLSDALAPEEGKILKTVGSFSDAYRDFAARVLRGNVNTTRVEHVGSRVVLRFREGVPAIIGKDMKPYGPFNVEDVAALPKENADILIKRGLAEAVEMV